MFNFDNINFANVKKYQEYNVHEISDSDIAIIGIATRLPMSGSIEDVWRNISQDADCFNSLSECRKEDIESYLSFLGEHSNNGYPKAAYLDRIDEFDYKFFKISPGQAKLMDPHHRIFLETVWHAIEDAGYSKEMLQGTNTGIFAGFNPRLEYKLMISNIEPSILSDALLGNLPSSLTGLVAFYLDLCGPNMTINTACSSSLVALHIACQSLKNKECDMAICGSIRLSLSPNDDYKNSDIGIVSKSNNIKAFDDDSDGTGGGEGCIVFLLKPLNVAIEQRDNIYAVIKGSSVNSDGHSASIAAPNALAQKRLIIQAWKSAGIDPETVSYIETHGTGTQLGDPIEFDGLQKAFEAYTNRKQFCAIGSVKSNYGHLDTAAGLLGVLKCILLLKHRMLPENKHFSVPSRRIDFETSALYINHKLKSWEVDCPRRCGVSSFGLSGTNAHIIMEEILPRENSVQDEKVFRLLVLSARRKENLLRIVNEYCNYIRLHKNIGLDDLCFTANTGRSCFECRLAIVFQGRLDLLDKLELLNGSNLEYRGDKIFYGDNTGNEPDDNRYAEIVDEMKRQEQLYFDKNILTRLAQMFVTGYRLNMNLLYDKLEPYRISLPGYQFSKSRCWFELKEVSKGQKIDNVQEEDLANEINLPFDIKVYEERIQRIWEDVLGYTDIQGNENYYSLGGDSLQAIKIVNIINKVLHCKLSVSDLLMHPTIMELAEGVYEQKTRIDSNDTIDRVENRDYYETSSTQKRFYIVNQLESRTIKYNMTNAVDLEGNLDVQRLQKAFEQLIERHEILRTSFLQIEDRIFQKTHNQICFNIEYIEACKLDTEYLIQQFQQPFDLGKAPLMRVQLIKKSEQKYILIFDIHHIIFDGASIGILIKDLLRLYFGQPLPELKIQYKDYVHWFNKRLDSISMKKQEKYWVEWLQGDLPKSVIPYTRRPHQPRTYTARSLWFHIPPEQTRSLSKIANRNNTTLYVVLLSVLGLLMSVYTGEEKIVIGTPVVGRNHKELENLIGSFINTLVIKLELNSEERFNQYVSYVRDIVLKALENQEYPYDKIVEKLKIRDSINALYDVVFAYHTNLRSEESEVNEIRVLEGKYKVNVATNEFTIDAVETGESIEFNIVYSEELYDEMVPLSFVQYFMNIVNQICNDDDMQLTDINHLTEIDREKYFNQYCRGKSETLSDKTVVHLFMDAAKKHSNELAVIDENGSLTYEQLDCDSNYLSSILNNYGVRNSIVGILMPRKKELLTAIWGVLKSGAAYMPIDSTYPKDRIQYMLDNSKVNILLTSESVEHPELFGIHCIYMDKLHEYNAIEDKSDSIVNIQPDTLAYVIYTSGTTGLPNGVKVSHRSLYNFVQGIEKEIPFQNRSVFLSLTTMSFDIFLLETLFPLVKGYKVVLANEREQRDIDLLSRLIEKAHVNVMQAVASRMSLMLSFQSFRQVISHISFLLIGGERFPDNLLKSLAEVYDGRVYNLYGPTETTIWSSVKCLNGTDEITIGKPMLNTNFYILNKKKHLMPLGCYGELYIGGKGVSNGYLNNEQLTRNKFIESPFETGEIIYKTGDIARILPNGEFYLIGREDSQVKLNGYRIELGEIETILTQIDGIKEVVVKKEHDKDREFLCGYFTSDIDVDIPQLKYRLAKKLPYYMIPKYLVQVQEFAKTSNGKNDRKVLPKPVEKKVEKIVESELESRIIGILQQVTKEQYINVEDNFFDLGLDSILLIQFHKQLQEELNCEIDITELFNNSSVKKVVHMLQDNFFSRGKRKKVTLLFPKEYFGIDENKKELSILTYELRDEFYTELIKVTKIYGLKIGEFLFCIYVVLVQLITEQNHGRMYFISTNDKRIYYKEFNMNTNDVVDNIISKLQRVIIQQKKLQEYDINTMVDSVSSQKGNEVVIGFCTNKERKEASRLMFDIIMNVDIQPSLIHINLEFTKRMDKNMMKNFLGKYIKLVNLVINQVLDV